MIKEPIAQALFWKYWKEGAKINTAQTEDGSFEITNWEHPDDVPEPDEIAIDTALKEYKADQAAKKEARKIRKKAVMSKLGLSKQELTALLELIEDRSDD